jgi:ABC-type branched-subunit amino acid transport system ATPase component
VAEAPIYEARGVSKSYGSVLALQDVSLAVHAGESVGLVGDNGAGKSTLVKVMSGVRAGTGSTPGPVSSPASRLRSRPICEATRPTRPPSASCCRPCACVARTAPTG